MAGVSTPELAAAVSNAGGLGSIAVGAMDPAGARASIEALRALTSQPFNVNVFVHRAPVRDDAREAAWLEAMAPLFRRLGATAPRSLRPIYTDFNSDDAMFGVLLELVPPVVSFHFGLPDAARLAALRERGCTLVANATRLEEAEAARLAGMDAVVAQGFEAGGHRGMFHPDVSDPCLGVFALTRLLVATCGLPVIAAGGVMDGQGIRAALDLGAVAAQLGTAFIACPESAADTAYREALASELAFHTVMTKAISGRLARGLRNRFTDWAAQTAREPPDYPIAYDAGKQLHAAAKAVGATGYAAHWAGQGAPLSRAMSASRLVETLAREAGLAPD
jgi:nitronate monooxygenase